MDATLTPACAQDFTDPAPYVPVFRRRSLAAVLTYLSALPDNCPVGEAVVQWCSREGLGLSADTWAGQARQAVRRALLDS